MAFVSGHPWIVDDTLAPDRPLGSAVLTRLKNFSAMNKLKKMALRVCFPFFFLFTSLSSRTYLKVIWLVSVDIDHASFGHA